jgi:hypothetical protein
VTKLLALAIVTMAGFACLPTQAMAQAADDTSAASQPPLGGSMGHHGHRNRQQDAGSSSAPTRISVPKLLPDPPQRLDVGALICATEAELRQHQAAIMARIAGGYAPEPAGCRVVEQMVAVSVVDRRGPARTEVRVHGQAGEVGWTDVRIPDVQAAAR